MPCGRSVYWLPLIATLLTAAVYWPGLYGGWLFDDYPNIVDNPGVQPHQLSVPALVRAALSSPASDFKRPLASLSFAINYLVTGLDPYWMKLTNLGIHLLNGWLVFFLTLELLKITALLKASSTKSAYAFAHAEMSRTSITALLVAWGWMSLPINLTNVLYVVQRMESIANLFVLVGLIGYIAGRRHMLCIDYNTPSAAPIRVNHSKWYGFILCAVSLIIPTTIGALAKETAVMLPLYAILIEWALFRFQSQAETRDRSIVTLFLVVLVVPMILGLAWLIPSMMNPGAWASRDFTLGTRLLSEARVVTDYIAWTLIPTLQALSFYHDNFLISSGLLSPWSTLPCVVLLSGLVVLAIWLRPRLPLVALGLALFLSAQLLTATVIPLELVYEHRNYFASFGLLLAIASLLRTPTAASFTLPRRVLLTGFMLYWVTLTACTAYAWGSPLRLAVELAARAPDSPRAQYELGRTYIIYSLYDPSSPFTHLAYAPLEKAAALPGSSILPEQALIFLNARMHLPIKEAWWDSMIKKLGAHPAGIQDDSSLSALVQCSISGDCDLPHNQMIEAFLAAFSHPHPSARLLASYGNYAWNVLGDRTLGEQMLEKAVETEPNESAYRITMVRMLAAQGREDDAKRALEKLQSINIGGTLDGTLSQLRSLLAQ